MKLLALLTVLLPCSAAHAGDPNVSPYGVHVLQMDEDFPVEDVAGEGLTIHHLHEVNANSETLPMPVLHRLFQKSGLAPYIKDWGALEQDLLALRCEKHESGRVFEKYEKKIPQDAIEKFQVLVKKHRMETERK
jgi:hypothetical protein